MESRHQREQEFHDARYSHEEGMRGETAKYYSITRYSIEMYRDLITAYGANNHVLEYGCGKGSFASFLARQGATVTGIDISAVAIAQAEEQARREQLETVNFLVMNAEVLEFDADSFDLVCGTGIIHHLDLDRAFSEVARTLKERGAAILIEPLGHNPLINLYRKMTPDLRSEDEHPLLMEDLKLAQQYFDRVEVHFFHLFTLLSVPFRKFPGFDLLVRALSAADKMLFGLLPFTRRFAWQVVIVLYEPNQNT